MADDILSRSDAKTKGLSEYFTGKACKHGHVAFRKTINGVCTSCIIDIDRRSRDKNREKHRAKWRKASVAARIRDPEKARLKTAKWSLANRDKELAKNQRWRDDNREKVRAQGRVLDKKWREANPEEYRLKNKLYKAANADRLEPIARARTKQWLIENPDKARENARKGRQHRRARILGAPGTYTKTQINNLLESQNWLCATPQCRVSLREAKELDHIIAIARGGSNDITNLNWLCPSCNRKKNAKSPEEWALVCERIFK